MTLVWGMSQEELVKGGKGLPAQRFQQEIPYCIIPSLRRKSPYRLHILLQQIDKGKVYALQIFSSRCTTAPLPFSASQNTFIRRMLP